MKQRDFTSAKAKEALLKDKDKFCGECCWFCFEMTDGDGQCVEVGDDGYPMMMTRCDSRACDKFVSIQEMRHHMAVLLQWERYMSDRSDLSLYRAPSIVDRNKAMAFAYRYMKKFSKL